MKRTSSIEGTQRGYLVSIYEGSKRIACEAFHCDLRALNQGGTAMHKTLDDTYALAKRYEAQAVSGHRPSWMKSA